MIFFIQLDSLRDLLGTSYRFKFVNKGFHFLRDYSIRIENRLWKNTSRKTNV